MIVFAWFAVASPFLLVAAVAGRAAYGRRRESRLTREVAEENRVLERFRNTGGGA